MNDGGQAARIASLRAALIARFPSAEVRVEAMDHGCDIGVGVWHDGVAHAFRVKKMADAEVVAEMAQAVDLADKLRKGLLD